MSERIEWFLLGRDLFSGLEGRAVSDKSSYDGFLMREWIPVSLSVSWDYKSGSSKRPQETEGEKLKNPSLGNNFFSYLVSGFSIFY